MTTHFVHATRKLDVPNPMWPYGVGTAATGAALLLLGAAPVLEHVSRGEVAALLERGLRPASTFVFLSLAIATPTLITGLAYALLGLRRCFKPWVPPGTPKGYWDREEIVNSLKKREIASYHSADVARLWTVRYLLGDRVLLLPPRVRRIALRLLAQGCRALLLALVLLAPVLVPPDSFEDRDLARIWMAIRQGGYWPLLAVLACGAVIRIVAALLLVPRRIPETLSHRKSQYVDGAGHPAAVFTQLEESAQALEWNGLPPRIWKESPALASGGVADTGTFTGTLLIEDQPRPAPPETRHVPAGLLLVAGGTTLLLGFWKLAGLRALLAALAPSMDPSLPGELAVNLLVALALIVQGGRLLGHSRRLYAGYRFDSRLFLMDFDGTFTRAQVTVGKAVVDSVESQNLVVRSEFSIVYHAAEADSETSGLDEPREILELRAAPGLLQDLARFESAVERYQSKGARPMAVDLGNPATHDIVKANVQISAIRRGAGPGGATATHQLSAGSSRVPSLPSPEEHETKNCPDCAEIVKAAARKCRFCGYRFE